MDIDLEDYKLFLKPHAREKLGYIFPFRHLLNIYDPLMRLIMKYFTCEGRFSRLYRYHIILLMHFTSTKPLDLPHFLYKSLLRITEKVQSRNKDHHPSLFHHGLVKLIVLHHLSSINMTWETFMEKVAATPTTSPLVMDSTPSPSVSSQPMKIGSYIM